MQQSEVEDFNSIISFYGTYTYNQLSGPETWTAILVYCIFSNRIKCFLFYCILWDKSF